MPGDLPPEEPPVWGTPEPGDHVIPPWGTPPPDPGASEPPTLRELLRSPTARVWLGAAALSAVLIGTGVVSGTDDSSGQPAPPAVVQQEPGTYVHEKDLAVGDCVQTESDGYPGGNAYVVPCSLDHNVEVAGVVDLPAGPWPGDDALQRSASTLCSELYAWYMGVVPDRSDYTLDVDAPDEDGWSDGDRHLVCTVDTGGGTGTVEGSGA